MSDPEAASVQSASSSKVSYVLTDVRVSSSKTKNNSNSAGPSGNGTVKVSVKSRPNRENQISISSCYKKKSLADASTQSLEGPAMVVESGECENTAKVNDSPSAYFPNKEAMSQPGSMQSGSERGPSPATAKMFEWDSAGDVGYRRVTTVVLSPVEKLALEAKPTKSEPENTPGSSRFKEAPAAESTPKEQHIFANVIVARNASSPSPEPRVRKNSSSPSTVRQQEPSDSESAPNGTLDSGPLTADARVNSFEYLPGHMIGDLKAGSSERQALEQNANLEAAMDHLVSLLGDQGVTTSRELLSRLLDGLASQDRSGDLHLQQESREDQLSQKNSSVESSDEQNARNKRKNRFRSELSDILNKSRSGESSSCSNNSKDSSRSQNAEVNSFARNNSYPRVAAHGTAVSSCRLDMNKVPSGQGPHDREFSSRTFNVRSMHDMQESVEGSLHSAISGASSSSGGKKSQDSSIRSQRSYQKEKSHQSIQASLGVQVADKCVGPGLSSSLSSSESEANVNRRSHFERSRHRSANVIGRKNTRADDNSDYAKSSDAHSTPPVKEFRKKGEAAAPLGSCPVNVENIAAIKEEMDREKKCHMYWISNEISQLTCLKKLLETREEIRTCYFRVKMLKDELKKTRADQLNLDLGSEGTQPSKLSRARPSSTTSTSTVKTDLFPEISPSEAGWTSHQYDSEVESSHNRGGGDADVLSKKHREITQRLRSEKARHTFDRHNKQEREKQKLEQEKRNQSVQTALKGVKEPITISSEAKSEVKTAIRKDPCFKTSSLKQVGPTTAYTIQFPPQALPKVTEKPSTSTIDSSKYDSDDIILTVGELRTAIDGIVAKHKSSVSFSQQPTLKDYLVNERPDVVTRAESRRQILNEITELRKARQEARNRVIAGDTNNLPPPPLVKRVVSQKELRKQTERKYRQLGEVLSKKAEMKRKQEYRTNRLMAQVFNRKLQKKTLQGQINLSNSVCVIGSS